MSPISKLIKVNKGDNDLLNLVTSFYLKFSPRDYVELHGTLNDEDKSGLETFKADTYKRRITEGLMHW